MATRYHELEGKILWANNLSTPDEYAGNSYYKANLVVDLDNFDKFKNSGVRTKTRKDSDGEPVVTIKRNSEPLVTKDGNEIGGGAPSVVDDSGNPWDRNKLIGNNSVVRVRYVTYDTKAGKGHRLEEVKVIRHVPYDDAKREAAEEPSVTPSKKVPW